MKDTVKPALNGIYITNQIIMSLNVTCSHHDIAANLLIWRYITTIHSIVIPVI
jgi:hypothetical protein